MFLAVKIAATRAFMLCAFGFAAARICRSAYGKDEPHEGAAYEACDGRFNGSCH